jgi:hypothetical protein
MWAIFGNILQSPIVSATSALVKLRVLADPAIGIHAGDPNDETVALLDVLDFFERLVPTLGEPGTGEKSTRRKC